MAPVTRSMLPVCGTDTVGFELFTSMMRTYLQVLKNTPKQNENTTKGLVAITMYDFAVKNKHIVETSNILRKMLLQKAHQFANESVVFATRSNDYIRILSV